MFEETSDLATAQEWAVAILREKNAAKYYMSAENFVAAYKGDGNFSFIVKGEPFYGHLYGAGAHLDPRCTNVAVADSRVEEDFKVKGGGFQFWEIETKSSQEPIELLSDAEEIAALIREHAPDSSVLPGDPEEVFWGGARNESNELVACAVVVKWQSGFHVMASVVTRTADRGRGYGTALSKGIAAHAHKIGIPLLGLGVRTGNLAAQRAYEKAGFKMLGAFTNYSRE
jgi:ribosomal protein S18 acetylase RimI-like enzyme